MIDKRINEILAIFQEFGPRRAIPVFTRWMEAFPDATENQMHEWHQYCRKVEDFSWDIAERVWKKEINKHQAVKELSEQFPQLNDDRIRDTYGQAMLFVCK